MLDRERCWTYKMLKEYPDDDGRVICDMNVEGMRWYNRNLSKVDDYRKSREKSAPYHSAGEVMTRRETVRYTFYAVLAGLTIVAVFATAWILLWLFSAYVWFK